MKQMIKWWKGFSLIGKLSIAYIILMLVVGLTYQMSGSILHEVPSGPALKKPGFEYIFGTDDLGIDLFYQICYGIVISMGIGLFVGLVAGFFGGILGMLAGYYGGKVDKLIMGFSDMFMSIPQMPLMIVLGAFLGASYMNIIIVLSLFSWVGPARISRSKMLALKQESYIVIAKNFGASFLHLSKKHFIPYIFPVIMVGVIRVISRAVIAEAGLAFLGLSDPTSKSWGLILNRAMGFQGIYFTDYWKWWIMIPLFFLTTLVVSIAFVGRDLEKSINQKL